MAPVGGLAEQYREQQAAAAALVVSVRTVGRHVDNIYGKLGIHGRRSVRQYAREHGLLSGGPAADVYSRSDAGAWEGTEAAASTT